MLETGIRAEKDDRKIANNNQSGPKHTSHHFSQVFTLSMARIYPWTKSQYIERQ